MCALRATMGQVSVTSGAGLEQRVTGKRPWAQPRNAFPAPPSASISCQPCLRELSPAGGSRSLGTWPGLGVEPRK